MRLLIISSQDYALDEAVLAEQGVSISYLNGIIGTAMDQIVEVNPDLLVVEVQGSSSALVPHLAQLQAILPHCVVVPVKAELSPEFLLKLIHSGIPDILQEVTTPLVLELVERYLQRQARQASSIRTIAQCIAFMPAKGGAGASFIASNLALAMARAVPDKRILLIDAGLPFGDIDLYLNMPRGSHDLGEFHESVERLDAALFRTMVQKVTANLDFIPAPGTFNAALNMEADRISSIIRKANIFYDFVLIDICSQINPTTVAILENAECVHLVATPDIMGARHAVQVTRLFDDLEFNPKKVTLCLNRQVAGSLLAERDFADTTGRRVTITIPEDMASVAHSISQGKSVLDVAPRSPISHALRKWAASLCGITNKETSLWHRLRGK